MVKHQKLADAETEKVEKASSEFKEQIGGGGDNFMAGISEMLSLLDGDDDDDFDEEAFNALIDAMTAGLEDEEEAEIQKKADKAGMSKDEYA